MIFIYILTFQECPQINKYYLNKTIKALIISNLIPENTSLMILQLSDNVIEITLISVDLPQIAVRNCNCHIDIGLKRNVVVLSSNFDVFNDKNHLNQNFFYDVVLLPVNSTLLFYKILYIVDFINIFVVRSSVWDIGTLFNKMLNIVE
jgi:hypothetical protein